MVSDEFIAATKEWADKQPNYADFMKSLPEHERMQVVTLMSIHHHCDRRTMEKMLSVYNGEYDYVLREEDPPAVPVPEYLCPKCGGEVRRLQSIVYTSHPPQFLYRCYECDYEKIDFYPPNI